MKYRKILAVISEHTGSTVSARYAIALAAAGGTELVLYSAHVDGEDKALARQVERHVDHLFDQALALNISVTRISETGFITRLLPHRAQVEEVDLVFYPLLPGESYGAPMQRQVAHHLLRTIRADLSLMRIMHMGKPHPHRILVPLGGIVSDREQRGKFLAALAKTFHSQITLFHRTDICGQNLPDDVIMLRNELRLHHLPILERSGAGGIAKAIALEAVSHHNDLIVLGASERGALRRLLFGNPAGDVMIQPPCNAILFRAAHPQP